MARADTTTKLSLSRWANLMGIHPLHFSQVILPEMPPTVCAQPWLQHAYQGVDRIGREDLAIAIRHAEDDIERELQSRLLPSWEVNEWRGTERFYRPELTNMSMTDIRGYGQMARSRWKHFISGGIESKSLVSAGAAIVYTDVDADGYDETATVTVGTTALNPCEINIYYPGKEADASWEIRPTNVVIAGGIATITFRRELVVLENLLEAFDANAVDGTDDGSFLDEVDVYRQYNDPQRQVQFLWEPLSGSCGNCGDTGCPSCSYNTQYGCLISIGDRRLGVVAYHPGEWNSEDLDFDPIGWGMSRQPDIVRLWYYSGIRDERITCSNKRMSSDWERVVAYYAASILDRPLCECNNVGEWVKWWRRDMALTGEGAEELASVDEDLLGNPFGTKRGAVNAWNHIRRARELPQEIAV